VAHLTRRLALEVFGVRGAVRRGVHVPPYHVTYGYPGG
jgi:hypothetical protein